MCGRPFVLSVRENLICNHLSLAPTPTFGARTPRTFDMSSADHGTAPLAELPSEAIRSGISRSAWHVAASFVFDELAAGRGVVVPGLGTFTIDVRERFKGTGGARVERQPFLTLSAHFERIGVKPPAQRPGGTVAAHMIGWQAVGERCGTDRDLARRAVAQTLAAFASKVAAMSTSSARSAACLDLGPCGKLRIVRIGQMKAGLEPRIAFSESLFLAVQRSARAARAGAPSVSAPSAAGAGDAGGAGATAAVGGPAAAAPQAPAPADVEEFVAALSLAEAARVATAAEAARVAAAAEAARVAAAVEADQGALERDAGRAFITLAGLKHYMPATHGWGECVSAAADAALDRPRKTIDISDAEAEHISHEIARAAGSARSPLEIAPRDAAGVDEWAFRKLQAAVNVGTGQRRVLSDGERQRRAEMDRANAQQMRVRGHAGKGVRTGRARPIAEQHGVQTLLQRLPSYAPPPEDASAGQHALSAATERSRAEAVALLLRKAQLEERLRELEQEIDVASVAGSHASRPSTAAGRRAAWG